MRGALLTQTITSWQWKTVQHQIL